MLTVEKLLEDEYEILHDGDQIVIALDHNQPSGTVIVFFQQDPAGEGLLQRRQIDTIGGEFVHAYAMAFGLRFEDIHVFLSKKDYIAWQDEGKVALFAENAATITDQHRINLLDLLDLIY